MNWRNFLIVGTSLVVASAAEPAKPVYENNFEKVATGSAPDDFLVLDGAFAVKQENAEKFLELPGEPLDTFGALFGPTEKEGFAVFARIFGTAKGRRFPNFGVGLNGAGGYKLQISPAKKLVELYRGDTVKISAPFAWESGKWFRLRLALAKTARRKNLEGRRRRTGSSDDCFRRQRGAASGPSIDLGQPIFRNTDSVRRPVSDGHPLEKERFRVDGAPVSV
jgi:hypothetical protein